VPEDKGTVQIIATNRYGASPPAVVNFMLVPKAGHRPGVHEDTSRLYLLSIGVGRYANPRYAVPTAATDARALVLGLGSDTQANPTVVSKLLVPETETPETLAAVPAEDESSRSKSLIGAIIEGAMDGLRLAAGISALIIAILGIVALIDKLLGVASSWIGMSEPLSMVRILGWLFYPLAYLLGLQSSDVPIAARLLGERVILTEVFSYNHLAQLISSGQLTDPRTVVILSYALCGFAHIAAMAIFVGGTAALAPSRRDDLASLGLRALLAATLATLMTGCIAGIFSNGAGVLTR